MDNSRSVEIGFWERLKLAYRVAFNRDSGRRAATALAPAPEPPSAPQPAQLPPERAHASALVLLAAFQREGRLIDFLRQDIAGFSDEEVGAAARVIHEGGRKVLDQYFKVEPAVAETEGDRMTVPAGFDAQRIRVTGNVSGRPPFTGQLKHHGWVTTEVRMPQVSESLDTRVLAPADLEV